MPIRFFVEDVKFSWKKKRILSDWLKNVAIAEGRTCDELNIILRSDEAQLHMNKEYLKHDFYTDVITFNYSEGENVNGEIYISLDRVKDNASKVKSTLYLELYRVVVHGLLHLLGYNDKTADDIRTMRSREDFYLTLLPDLMFHVKHNAIQ